MGAAARVGNVKGVFHWCGSSGRGGEGKAGGSRRVPSCFLKEKQGNRNENRLRFSTLPPTSSFSKRPCPTGGSDGCVHRNEMKQPRNPAAPRPVLPVPRPIADTKPLLQSLIEEEIKHSDPSRENKTWGDGGSGNRGFRGARGAVTAPSNTIEHH